MKLELIEKKPDSIAHKTPILFVHGMWHGAWCWDEFFLPYLVSRGFHVFALSLRGHGKSEGREKLRWNSINNYVEDVHQVVEQIRDSPVLVGHSMGGFIVQKYLEQYSVPSAVLLAPAPAKGVLAATMRVLSKHPLAFLKANLTLSMYPIISTTALCKEFFFSSEMPDRDIARYHSQMQDEAYRAYLDMMILNLPKVSRIKTRMLVLGGEADNIISPTEMKSTAESYGAELEMFKGMAHDMMLEKEWQKVADRIINWMNNHN
ncbi:lysophospholipase [bacterium]|nr:lysophospholipase [bacterium]